MELFQICESLERDSEGSFAFVAIQAWYPKPKKDLGPWESDLIFGALSLEMGLKKFRLPY